MIFYLTIKLFCFLHQSIFVDPSAVTFAMHLFQGYSTFIYQAFHLDNSFGSVTLAVSWIALVNIIAVLSFVKLLEKIVYPALRRNGHRFPTKWRIIVGMICALISMFLGMQIFFLTSNYICFLIMLIKSLEILNCSKTQTLPIFTTTDYPTG